MMSVDAQVHDYSDKDNVELDESANMMTGAMKKTKARTMLTRWCYGCYHGKDKGDG